MNAKSRFNQEVEANGQIIRYLKRRLSEANYEMLRDRESNSCELQELDAKYKEVKEKREHNLKGLLNLRVKWNRYEEEQQEIKRERERVEEVEILEVKRREAVEVIANRLSLLYRSKLQKKMLQRNRNQIKRKKRK